MKKKKFEKKLELKKITIAVLQKQEMHVVRGYGTDGPVLCSAGTHCDLIPDPDPDPNPS